MSEVAAEINVPVQVYNYRSRDFFVFIHYYVRRDRGLFRARTILPPNDQRPLYVNASARCPRRLPSVLGRLALVFTVPRLLSPPFLPVRFRIGGGGAPKISRRLCRWTRTVVVCPGYRFRRSRPCVKCAILFCLIVPRARSFARGRTRTRRDCRLVSVPFTSPPPPPPHRFVIVARASVTDKKIQYEPTVYRLLLLLYVV